MDDLISRKAFMDHVEKEYTQWGSDYDIEQVLGDLEDFPGAQPERGHWIEIRNKRGVVIAIKCDKCSRFPKRGVKSDFCPNCGVDMRGE